MYDDLRELVRAECNRNIKRIRVSVRRGTLTVREGETEITTEKTTRDDLLTLIDDAETALEA